MKEKVLVFTAWPYANGDLHLGHLAGCYLPADIFARFRRMRGDDVVMLSGSDQHGTPITVTAEREGISPKEVANRYHDYFLQCWEKVGISYNLFTSTGTKNHQETVHEVFLDLLEKGYIYKDSMQSPYCDKCERFLPDRYVEGECPFCGFADARGDQCDNCGKPLNPEDLKNSRCKLCGATPVIKETEHFFLKLTAFNEALLEWVTEKTHFRPNVYAFTKQYLTDGLKDRAITRDIKWGIPVPVEGFEDKRIYVWFEAVIGYLSAARQWAAESGNPEKWQEYWKNHECRAFYFIGKDNIPFHTIIWPAILMGYGHDLQLPYDVPSNEYLTLEGRQFSTSRNWAVWVPDYLKRYDSDPLRFALAINMPETSDTDFSWREYFRRNNNELVATYGNLIHRTLSFTHKKFEGKVPEPGELDEKDREILALAGQTLKDMEEQLMRCSFREALRACMKLAQESNRYLEVTSPWISIKEDKAKAATNLWVTFQLINALKVAFYPYLPFSSEKLHRMLGYRDKIEERGWLAEEIPGGLAFDKPETLFVKLEESMIEEELSLMK